MLLGSILVAVLLVLEAAAKAALLSGLLVVTLTVRLLSLRSESSSGLVVISALSAALTVKSAVLSTALSVKSVILSLALTGSRSVALRSRLRESVVLCLRSLLRCALSCGTIGGCLYR